MRILLLLFALFPISATALECGDFNKAVARGSANQKLQRFMRLHEQLQVDQFPEAAAIAGEMGAGDRWTDWSEGAIRRRKALTLCQSSALNRIKPAGLSEDEALNLRLLRDKLQMTIAEYAFPFELLPLHSLLNSQTDILNVLRAKPTVQRLEGIPSLARDVEGLLRQGLMRGVTPPRSSLKGVLAVIDKLCADPESNPLLDPFRSTPAADQARAALKQHAIPALRKLREFVREKYEPKARASISWSELPNGAAWYSHLIRANTSSQHSPEQLHALGLKEVARLNKEMDAVRGKTRFKGDRRAFHRHLLSESAYFFSDKEELMSAYRALIARLEVRVPTLFHTMPQLKLEVREMGGILAANSPAAYYARGNPITKRPAHFEINTHDLTSRPKWEMEAIALHEALPGHHLQMSREVEQANLPHFRRHSTNPAFREGWAFYAESLGQELGFYQDPYSKYGALVCDLWRSVRLVLDTGLHSQGWSRTRALDYFMEMLPKSRAEAEAEIDRYIARPGQALAYKMGQVKFQELRAKARRTLGDGFDPRDFHEEILRHGSLPLDVLEDVMDRWLIRKRGTSTMK